RREGRDEQRDDRRRDRDEQAVDERLPDTVLVEYGLVVLEREVVRRRERGPPPGCGQLLLRPERAHQQPDRRYGPEHHEGDDGEVQDDPASFARPAGGNWPDDAGGVRRGDLLRRHRIDSWARN